MWGRASPSLFWLDLRNRIAVIYASQIYPFGEERTFCLFLEVETAVYVGPS